MPSLSVIVPVFNQATYVGDALRSLLNEQIPDTEIIVSDDGSTDESREIALGYPVRIVRSAKNQGPATARNAALEQARGPYIAFLDADDVLIPGGLRSRWKYLEANSHESVVGSCRVELMDPSGERLHHLETQFYRQRYPFDRLSWEHYRSGWRVPLLLWNFLFRRSVFDEIGKMDPSLEPADDVDYLLRVLKTRSVPILPEPVVRRRLHGNNLTFDYDPTSRTGSRRTRAMSMARLTRMTHGLV